MASQPVTTGAHVGAPSIPTLARRSFLGALAAAPAVALPALPSVLTTSVSAGRAVWDRTFAAMQAAKRAFEDYDKHVWEPTHARLMRESPRPDMFFEITGKSGVTTRYDLRADRLHEWDDHVSLIFREKAAQQREAWLRHRAVADRLGWDKVSKTIDRLCAGQCDLEAELMRIPAPDSAALLWKLDHMFGPDAGSEEGYSPSYCSAWMDAVMADARRLLSAGKA